jgi:uncharacterized protein (DUF1810 family)
MSDAFNLDRFIDAQSETFDRAQAELRQGHKRSHWMWFIFPQSIVTKSRDKDAALRFMKKTLKGIVRLIAPSRFPASQNPLSV